MESDDQSGGSRGHQEDKDSEEYRQKRDRNNLAVKKSREKSRQKTSETAQRMGTLREENLRLEQKVSDLSKELGVMKELLLAHARGNKVKEEVTATSVPSQVATYTNSGTTVPIEAAAAASTRWPSQSAASVRSPIPAKQMKHDEQVTILYTIPAHSDHEYFVATSDDSIDFKLDVNSTCDSEDLKTPGGVYHGTYCDG